MIKYSNLSGDALRYAIRPMKLEDIPQAKEIDRESFPTQLPPPYKQDLLYNTFSRYFVAWEVEGAANGPSEVQPPQQGQRAWGQLRGRLRHFLSERSASTTGRSIVGVVGLWIVAGEAHLTTIAVREAYRRQGIGELLLISAIDHALLRNADVVTLEVRASNLTAQSLYEKYGFSRVGLRRGYYIADGEDAVVMSTERLSSASFQSRFQRLKQAHAQRLGPSERLLD